MIKHKLTLTYLALFLLIGIASVTILHHTQKITAIKSSNNTIDSFITGVSFTEYNTQGEIKTKITAEKVIHRIQPHETIAKQPRIITYTADRTPIHIRADQAIGHQANHKIILQGNVVIHQLATAHHAGMTVKTSEMTLFPKISRAETHKPITLSRPGVVIHAIGFTADLKTGQYQLLSTSKAIYTPANQHH